MLALVLLAMRALVPAGYMPQAQALAAGRFVMTICLGTGGMKTVVVDSSHSSVDAASLLDVEHPSDPPADSSSPLEQCTFALLGVMVALPVLWQALVVLLLGAVAILSARPLSVPPRSEPPGPPLGSRAPPTLLA
jgi:hypothetical protein